MLGILSDCVPASISAFLVMTGHWASDTGLCGVSAMSRDDPLSAVACRLVTSQSVSQRHSRNCDRVAAAENSGDDQPGPAQSAGWESRDSEPVTPVASAAILTLCWMTKMQPTVSDFSPPGKVAGQVVNTSELIL